MTLNATEMIAYYCGRWNIETTFQEMRSHLDLETTRGRCAKTVMRAAPCLFGLYSVVALLYEATPSEQRCGAIAWPGKTTVTFSDALACVRHRIWSEGILSQAAGASGVTKLSPLFQELLLTTLAPAA